MMKKHFSDGFFKTENSSENKQNQTVTNRNLKRSKASFLMLFVALFSFAYSFGQTTLISPTGDGGFENGATFAANGWTAANSTNNPWVIGTAVTSAPIVGNSAYISNDGGVTNAYTPGDRATNYFYRDVVIPAGETKIKLMFDWNSQGENSWDIWQVFYAPTSVTPVGNADHPGSGTTAVPAGIAGSTYIGNGSLITGVQSASYYLPASLAGTTIRLIFSWKNEITGTQPPASIDNISLVSSAPGNFVSIVTGNWGTASTWDVNDVPTAYDNVTVSTGHVVTIDAANQATKDLIVNGTLTYGTTPTTFAVNGNLTLNTGGIFNVFNSTTGKTVTVAGNITNNGTMDLSVGTTTSGNLTLNGTTVQSVTGSGTFNTGVIRNLIFNNSNVATPNINWSINNVKVAYNLNLTGARINLGTNKMTFGNSAAGNTLTSPNGSGFLPGGKFSRWWLATGTGTGLTAGSDPTGTASRYPFINAAGFNRAMYITRTNTTGAVAGELAVTYNDASTVTSGLSIVDGAYTVTDRYDGNWSVSNEGTAVSASSYSLAIMAQNAYVPANGNSRILGASAAISGTHQNGTTTPGVQRTLVSQADLLAGPLYIGIASLDIPFVSASNGDWNNATTWNKGTIPTCTDAIVIANGHNVTVNSAGNVSKTITINTGGTLTVASGDLTVGCTMKNNSLINSGTLSVTGGTLNINGNLLSNSGSTFNQSGGDINIDGNDAGVTANSVASGTAIVQINTNLVNWTGGTLTIVDPHAATTATNTFTYTVSSLYVDVTSGHTIRFGDGVSTDAGGHINGFRINTWASSGRILFNNLLVNGPIGTNRLLTTQYSFGVHGNFTINTGGEYFDNSSVTYVGGNILNNGIATHQSTLYLGTYLSGTAAATSKAQTISGSGVFRNSTTTVTANLASLTVNNTNATGVTLSVPLSVSGTLTMTSGLINTTNANLLSLGTATATGTLSGTPSATNMVKGPFARTIANANSAYVLFPVGSSTYSPISLAPTTTAVSVMKAEAFNSNAGTANPAIINLSSARRWEAALVSGTFTDVNVRLGDALIVAMNIPVQAPSAAGVYTNSFGSVATYAAGTPNTTQSNNAVASADFTGFLSFAESNVCSGTPAPGNTIASASTICLGETVALSVQNATPGTGVTYQWQSSTDGVLYTDIVGATSATLSATPATALYYQNVVTCATGPASGNTTPVQITFANTVTASVPATRCGTGTVILDATPSAGSSIKWYANQIGGVALGTGASFTTPTISTTTTYFAGAEIASSATGLARLSPAVTSGITPSNYGLVFNANQEFTINSVDVFLNTVTSGNVTVILQNSLGATLSTVTVAVPAGNVATPVQHTLNLGFNVPAGTGYRLLATTGVSMVRESSLGGFPYSLGVNGSITEGYISGTSTTYYYFYNWNLTTTCSSPRLPVLATVTTPPAITLSSASEAVCAGQSTPTVTLTAGSTDYDTYTWSPATGVSGDEVSGYVFNPTATTTYTLTATQTAGSLCATTVDFLVNVNALPSALTVTPATAAVCENVIQTLTATGGTIGISGKVGSGTSSNSTSTPFRNYYGGSKTQALYTAAELSSMGMLAGEKINSIGYVAVAGTPTLMNDFTISAGFVSNTSIGTAFIAGANNTVLATTAYTPSTGSGNIDFALSTPLLWDGVSNLLVETCFNNINTGSGSASTVSVESSTVASGLNSFLSDDSEPTLCSNADVPTTSTSRPNLRISTIESTNITWSPVTNLYTDAAGTVAYVGGTNATTVYVKSATAGTNTYTASAANPSTLCARTATANVTVSTPTTNSTTATACGTYTWAVNGTAYTVSGTYTVVTGCATEELVLTINPATSNTTTVSVCDTYTWSVDNVVYNTSGIYTVVTGCDTEILDLTITPTTTNTTTETACGTYTWAVDGLAYTTSGTYTVVTGCATEILVLTITPNTSTLTTETACGTYTWVTTGLAYTTSGTYTKVTGCNVDSLVLTINALPVATVTRSGDDLTVNTTPGATYQWVKCDGSFTAIAGATSASYQATALGQYAVKVTKNGCTTTSACFDVTTLDVKSLEVANLNLYPNPVTNALTVTYTKNITGVQVYDMTGRLLKNIVTNTNEVSVDMSEMPASIYIVKVIAENTFSEFKVVKN